jgi:hypothetical protein
MATFFGGKRVGCLAPAGMLFRAARAGTVAGSWPAAATPAGRRGLSPGTRFFVPPPSDGAVPGHLAGLPVAAADVHAAVRQAASGAASQRHRRGEILFMCVTFPSSGRAAAN